MGNQLAELVLERMRIDVATECAEYDRIDSERIMEQIKKRPGAYESIAGFYVEDSDSCGPMYLTQDSSQLMGEVADWPVKTLFHSSHNMTIFLNQKRAMEAIRDTKKRIGRFGYLPFSGINIFPTGEGKLVYHFSDDNSRVWLPTSDFIKICDELPRKSWFGIHF